MKIFNLFKLIFILYFLIGVLFSFVGGFFTSQIKGKASENIYYDNILEVKSAYVDKDNYINICIDAVLAGKYIKDSYTLRFPLLTDIKGGGIGTPNDYKSKLSTGRILLQHKSIKLACENISNRNQIPISAIQMDYYQARPESDEVEAKKTLTGHDFTLFQITVRDEGTGTLMEGKEILIVGNESLAMDKKYAFVSIDGVVMRGSYFWFLLLPVTIAVDALIFPYELYVYFNYKGGF